MADDMSLEEIRIAIAENQAKIAEINRQHAQNLHAIADEYQEIADNIDDPDNKDILDEFVRHHGGDRKIGRQRAVSHFKEAARDKRRLAAEPLSTRLAKPAPAQAPADNGPWMKRLLGQE